MEDKLRTTLDQLDAEETEKLLSTEMTMKIDARTARRIQSRVYKQAGLLPVRRRRLRHRLAAAALLIVLFSGFLSFGGYQPVADALGKLFGFVPGHGIVDSTSELLYRMSETEVKAENEDYMLTLQNAIATKSTVSVVIQLKNKNGEKSSINSEEKENLLQHAANLQNLRLIAAGKQYDMHGWVQGFNPNYTQITGNFSLPITDLPADTVYTLEDSQTQLSVQFHLQAYDSFQSLEDIGPTVYLKHVSVTATTERKGNLLNVNLYSLSDKLYEVSSFTRDKYNTALSGDMFLETTQGERPYIVSDAPATLPITQYSFAVTADEQPRTLHIPHLSLKSAESNTIKLPIPKMNEKQIINRELVYRDGSIKILAVERVKYSPSESDQAVDSLKLSLAYTNSEEEMKLGWVYLDGPNTGGFGWEFNEQGEAATYYYSLAGYDQSSIELELKNPEYRLSEGLQIQFDMDKTVLDLK